MCKSYNWSVLSHSSLLSHFLPLTTRRSYECGCPAPKSILTPTHRCPLFISNTHRHKNKPCITSTNQTFYLPFSCSVNCEPFLDLDEGYFGYKDDSYLFYGNSNFEGMTSAEDRFFGRSRSPEGWRGEKKSSVMKSCNADGELGEDAGVGGDYVAEFVERKKGLRKGE